MNSSSGFDLHFAEVASMSGWVGDSLSSGKAILSWEGFVEDCEAGFPWDLDDYANSLILRTAIDSVSKRASSVYATQVSDVERSVGELDGRLKRVMRKRDMFLSFPVEAWWLRRVPRFAAREFSRSFERAYGVKISESSKFDNSLEVISRMKSRGVPASEVMISVKNADSYMASRPGLLCKAFVESFPELAQYRRNVWKWAQGELGGESLPM